MNKFNRKAKNETTKKSKSSATPTSKQKKREQLSESDSRSECHIKKGGRKRVDPKPPPPPPKSPEKEKRSNSTMAKVIKNAVVQRTPFSPAKRQKQPQSTPPGSDMKKQPKSDTEERERRKNAKESHSLSGSQETVTPERVTRPTKLFENSRNIRSERSLIGLDGETEMEVERKGFVKKVVAPPPLGSPRGSSQEDSSATETKDSISLADDEEQRDAYKKLFKEFAMNSQKLTLDDFRHEFSTLPGDPTREQCVAFNSLTNTKKNRYTNIPCLDVSRVRLTFMANKNILGSEYIHANYIKSPFLKRDYILTQGPKKETVADFWRMIWQEKTTAIVMLCQFVETQREKCVEYFPRNANSTLRFDKLILIYEESTVNKSLVTTRLKLSYEGESRLITHFQWREWPDYQVPGSSEVMLKILRKVRARGTPPVIHCAAGVGRSGTLMAVEIALQAINSFYKLPDIKQIVTELRLSGRATAVQTLQQYMLIWKVVLDFGVSNNLISEDSVGKFASTYRRSFRNANSS